jgi:predicted phosphodiesterase
MRIAVISDIHANLHALTAVLAAVDAEGADEIWCLGDLVGYGPRPEEVVTTVRERTAVCLAGNHDLGVLGTLDLELFAGDAYDAALWTRGQLTDESRDYLAALRPAGVARGFGLYHGSPRDPVWEYVLDGWTAAAALGTANERHILVGHSHVALQVGVSEETLSGTGGPASAGTEVRLDANRALLNPGSVGQPRDGDPRAAWLAIDLDAGRALFRREDYPIAQTQAEIRDAGLPETLAARLEFGL